MCCCFFCCSAGDGRPLWSPSEKPFVLWAKTTGDGGAPGYGSVKWPRVDWKLLVALCSHASLIFLWSDVKTPWKGLFFILDTAQGLLMLLVKIQFFQEYLKNLLEMSFFEFAAAAEQPCLLNCQYVPEKQWRAFVCCRSYSTWLLSKPWKFPVSMSTCYSVTLWWESYYLLRHVEKLHHNGKQE